MAVKCPADSLSVHCLGLPHRLDTLIQSLGLVPRTPAQIKMAYKFKNMFAETRRQVARYHQQTSPKCWYLSPKLHGITSHKTVIFRLLFTPFPDLRSLIVHVTVRNAKSNGSQKDSRACRGTSRANLYQTEAYLWRQTDRSVEYKMKAKLIFSANGTV
jgi:hypothetical protein